MRSLRWTIVLALLLSGCTTSGVVSETLTSYFPNGQMKERHTVRRASIANVSKDAPQQLADMGESAWAMVPDSVKVAGLSALGVGGLGFHTVRVRKHKERSFNKALSLRLGPPEVKP